jgi:hypothetical protein
MSVARIETLTWVLIFAGLATLGLGWSVQRSDDLLGWVLMGGGIVAMGAGALLVWVRSRMHDEA